MKNLKARPFALLVFGIFAACFVGLAFTSGATVTDVWSALWLAYKTVPMLLFLGAIFVAYGWRLPIFRRWLVPFPDLNGTWQGTIQTTWKDPETGKTPGPIPVILTVKQSFISISCVMRTAEMCSRSYFADFWIDRDQQVQKLAYSYSSSPLPSVRHRSPPHDGTMVFDVVGNPATKLNGQYWTSRGTAGEVILTFRSRDLLEELPNDLGEHPMRNQ
ncbi:MAG: hypothetical protein CV081_11800 [Nitrospira sp. LK265]|nr:hypothetical protein [Nitrospira sp. LK265]